MSNNTKQNNLTSIIAGSILVVGIAALVIIGVKNSGSSSNSDYSAGIISVIENEFDFGEISMSNGVVKHNFVLKNEGEESLKIGKIYTSCMCTTAFLTDSSGETTGPFGMSGHGVLKYANVEVSPGKEITIEANFDPAAHGPSGVGLAERSVYFETNSSKSPKGELKFKATVTN